MKIQLQQKPLISQFPQTPIPKIDVAATFTYGALSASEFGGISAVQILRRICCSSALVVARADWVPRNLRMFLNHRSHTFVRIWNHSDRRKLKRSEQCLDMCCDPLDLRYFAETENVESLVQDSVEEIVERCLGYIVEKRNDGLAYQFAYLNCIEKK